MSLEDDALIPLRGTGTFERVNMMVAASRLPNAFALAAKLRTLWNPWTCPASELPILAWAFSVDYWNEGWSEPRKRQVVAEARLYHSRKTTVAGTRMAIGYRDARLVRAYTPRQGFFCDTAVDVTAEAAWRSALPEIRVYDAAPVILRRRPAIFVGVDFVARGDARLARRATLVKGAVETPLVVIPLGDPSRRGERLVLPIPSRNALIVNRAGSRAALSNDLGVTTLAVRLGDGDFFARPLTTPGDVGAFVQSRRRLVSGVRVVFTPSGRGGRRFAAPIAISRGYTSLRFSDEPGRLVSHKPLNVVGKSRVMRAPFTANFLVDWHRTILRSRLAPGRKVASSAEPIILNLMQAIIDTQATRDQNTLSLNATRRLTYADLRTLKAGARYGDRREN